MVSADARTSITTRNPVAQSSGGSPIEIGWVSGLGVLDVAQEVDALLPGFGEGRISPGEGRHVPDVLRTGFALNLPVLAMSEVKFAQVFEVALPHLPDGRIPKINGRRLDQFPLHGSKDRIVKNVPEGFIAELLENGKENGLNKTVNAVFRLDPLLGDDEARAVPGRVAEEPLELLFFDPDVPAIRVTEEGHDGDHAFSVQFVIPVSWRS